MGTPSSTSSSPLVLYGNSVWSSPYVLSVFVALREKALPFEVRTVALDQGAHREASFTARSLTSRVPVLVDGELALSESSAIVEYLEDRFAPPAYTRLLPEAVRDRARARQVMAWLRSDLLPIREERSAEYVFYPHAALPPLAPLSDDARRAADKLFGAAERLVPEAAGPILGAWCIADTELAMMLQRLIKSGEPMPSKLVAFARREWERPSVMAYVDQPRPAFRKGV